MRNKCVTVMVINVGIEILINNLIESYFGVRNLRYLFIIVQCIVIGSAERKSIELEAVIAHQFNTPRLERVFKKVINDSEFLNVHRSVISCLPSTRQWQFAPLNT
jgi:hypothetical protein